CADFRLVVDDQQARSPRAGGTGHNFFRLLRLLFRQMCRQQHLEHRPAFGRAVHGQTTTVALDDAETDREPDARTAAWRLGREVRIEDARTNRRRNTRTVVGDENPHALALPIAGDAKPAWRRLTFHRLLRVDDQVQEHLVQLIGIARDRRQVRRELFLDRDTCGAQAVAEHFHAVVEYRVDLHRRLLRLALAGHREKRLDDARASFGRGPDLVGDGARALVGRLLLQHGRAAHDDGQRIVQFMRHTREQRSHGREFLALVQVLALPGDLRLRFLGLGNVAGVDDDAIDGAIADLVRAGGLHPAPGSIRVTQAELRTLHHFTGQTDDRLQFRRQF